MLGYVGNLVKFILCVLLMKCRFDQRYAPWLFFHPRRHGITAPLLDIAYCAVASRHLDHNTRARVGPQLARLATETFTREIFRPTPTSESILGVIILSMWSPIFSGGTYLLDSRLLIGSAVSLSMNLQLSQAAAQVLDFREGQVTDEESVNDAREKARVVRFGYLGFLFLFGIK